jgi:uncharacterized protein YicC (UPF0701 family)
MSTYTDIGLVLIALTQIGSFLVMWRKLSGVTEARTISPQPLEVKAVGELMTRDACREFHAQTAKFEQARFDEIAKQIAALTNAIERRNGEGEMRASKIHGRIDNVVESVSELRGQVSNHIHEHRNRQ